RPVRKFPAPEFNRDTATRRIRQAGPSPTACARRAARQTYRARARGPAVSRHCTYSRFDRVPRRLRRDREVPVGNVALDRDRLDQVSGVRVDHVSGDAAGVASLLATLAAAGLAGAARYRAI